VASIRAKLTTAYAVALVGTVTAFGAALWVGRGASMYRELQHYVFSEADVALRIIADARRGVQPVAETRDSLVGPQIAGGLDTSLAVLPDYLVVLDSGGRALYLSNRARRLRPGDLDAFIKAARQLKSSTVAAVLTLDGDQVLVGARDAPIELRPATRVAAGASTSSTVLSRQELLGTMLVIAPFLLGASVFGAYVIAGRAFRPVDHIINEVEAITDGRSLHRRLAVDAAGDELARLAATLNAMIGRLETSFAALRRFTADASHELKTPLTVLRADVERAMHAHVSPAEQLVALEEALQETTRMADLVDSLLTLARADEGRFDLHREPVALDALTRDVYETAHILGEEAGLQVSLRAIEGSTVMGDAARLRRLFLNLITNAIKYTPRGGRVELSLTTYEGFAVFSVRDTGIGIAAADLPYIFDRFWRADRARSRVVSVGDGTWATERGGFGLGLAISQYIAHAHGGTLAVQSRLARGSTFTVTLPVAAEPAPLTIESAGGFTIS
jgi:signal transduction histidine kinase